MFVETARAVPGLVGLALAVCGAVSLAACPRTSADVATDTAPDGGGGAPSSGGASVPSDSPSGDGGGDAGGGDAGGGDAGQGAGSPGMNFEVVAGTAPCKTDADCFPTECCHPAACGNTPVNCAEQMCTMDCKTGTMDCGGGCSCVEGKCAARILVSIGGE